jgi:succinate-semialdehyde dehydrogenase / glutarate-semialdehyde dehydrogenase
MMFDRGDNGHGKRMSTTHAPTTPAARTGASGIPFATDHEVDRAVAAAVTASPGWERTSPGDRAAALRDAAAAVREASTDLGDLLCDTTGRLHREAVASAQVAADLFDEAAVAGLGVAGRALAGSPGSADWVRAEPHGVVAVLTPWNDPFPAAAGLLAAALVTGNTVVHKPSERSLEPGLLLARLVQRCLPPGVLEVLAGDGEVGARLVADERVRVVAHVGSSTTGRAITTACGARGAKALVENGGKDALVVDAGVDPTWAAQQVATGAFTNAGQLCTAVERVYVHEAVADRLLAELVGLAESLRAGDPRQEASTLCRLVDERQLAVVESHVDDAVTRGARCLTGGRRLDLPGPFYAPTVLTDVTEDLAVMTEETFGPVAPVIVVASWEEGLRRANSGAYGLAATVLTPDQRHALQSVEELDVGTVKVNAVFGGAPGGSADPRRSSGQGRGYGPDLLGEFQLLKAVHWEPTPRSGHPGSRLS